MIKCQNGRKIRQLSFEYLYNVSEIVSVCFFSSLAISLVSLLRENCNQTKQMIVFYRNERKKDRKIFTAQNKEEFDWMILFSIAAKIILSFEMTRFLISSAKRYRLSKKLKHTSTIKVTLKSNENNKIGRLKAYIGMPLENLLDQMMARLRVIDQQQDTFSCPK